MVELVLYLLSIKVAAIAMCIIMFGSTLVAARKLHNKMVERVSRAPTSFFDSNPVGRILNRFSKDTAILDT